MRERDLSALRRLLADGSDDDRDSAAPLPWAVLDGLRAFLSCDTLAFFNVDSARRMCNVNQEAPARLSGPDPNAAAESHALFFQHYWDCTVCSYPDRTADLDSVITVSDFYSLRQFRDTGMWSEYLCEIGWDREMLACLAGVPGRTLRLICWRGPGRDFTERDRTVLWLLRPHLAQIFHRRRAARDGRAPLTPRQRELLGLVAAGHTNGQIARRLGVADSTVRKHLENIFGRLEVTSRTAALTRVFPERALPPTLDVIRGGES